MAGWILLLFCFIAAIDKALVSSGGSDGGGNADSHLEICIPFMIFIGAWGKNSVSPLSPTSLLNTPWLPIDKKLFALKRKEQIQTAEQVWNIRDYAKQYKTIQFLMETLFPVR